MRPGRTSAKSAAGSVGIAMQRFGLTCTIPAHLGFVFRTLSSFPSLLRPIPTTSQSSKMKFEVPHARFVHAVSTEYIVEAYRPSAPRHAYRGLCTRRPHNNAPRSLTCDLGCNTFNSTLTEPHNHHFARHTRPAVLPLQNFFQSLAGWGDLGMSTSTPASKTYDPKKPHQTFLGSYRVLYLIMHP